MRYTKDRIEIRAGSHHWLRTSIELSIYKLDMDERKRYIAKPLEFEEITTDDCFKVLDPSISISFDEAQVLIDDLWRAGVRPTEGAGSAGQMAATEKHLNDMRKLVFKDES